MNVLLIDPPDALSWKNRPRTPSLALLYLAAVLEREKFHVKILDTSLGGHSKAGSQSYYGLSESEIENVIKEFNPQVVGITCLYTSRWPFVQLVAQIVKRVQPEVLTVTGGIHPSATTKRCLETCNEIDFIVIGEGEYSFLQLCKAIDGKANQSTLFEELSQIDGLGYREDDEIRINPKTKFIENLDELPFPAYHLIDLEEYFKGKRHLYDLRGRMLPILSSRSCPQRCYFCDMFMAHGSKWRPRSADNVLDEIEHLHKTYSVDQFFVVDDNITFKRERTVEICNGIKDRGLKIRWNTPNGVMVKTLDPELIDLMKSSGLVSFCFGIESGSEYIRNEVYGKRLSTAKIQEVVGHCHKVGLPTVGFFLVGAPQETEETIKESIELVKKLPLSMITVSILSPYVGTRLFEDCVEKGYINQDTAELLFSGNIAEQRTTCIATENFDNEKVEQWRKQVYTAFIQSHFWSLLSDVILRRNNILNWDSFTALVTRVFKVWDNRNPPQEQNQQGLLSPKVSSE